MSEQLNISLATVLVVLFYIFFGYLVLRVLRWFVTFVAERVSKRLRLTLLALLPVMQLMIVAMIGLLIASTLLREEGSLLATFGAAAIAIGFAFQDYISSLIAGIVTIYERPYTIGDWIELDGVYGEVKSIGFRAVELVTADDTLVIIPHKAIWGSAIHNNNDGLPEHLCVADFYLHPDHDAKHVRMRLRDVALTSPYLKLDKPVAVVAFEKPWGTHYRVKGYPVDGRDQYQFVTDLTVRGKAALTQLKVRWANQVTSSVA